MMRRVPIPTAVVEAKCQSPAPTIATRIGITAWCADAAELPHDDVPRHDDVHNNPKTRSRYRATRASCACQRRRYHRARRTSACGHVLSWSCMTNLGGSARRQLILFTSNFRFR